MELGGLRFPDPAIEEYRIKGKPVLVVREDLVAPWPGPNFSKIRGLYAHLLRLREAGMTEFASQDTSISRCGWGCSYIARELGMTHYNVYAERRELKFYQRMSRALGGVMVPVRGSFSGAMIAQAKKQLPGVHFLPIGLSLVETLEEHKRLLAHLPKMRGSIVVASSSGTIGAGVVYGLQGGHVYAVMTSCFKNRLAKITGLVRLAEARCGRKQGEVYLSVVDAGYRYTDAEMIDTPFPCDIYLDRKAWRWLELNIGQLEDPVVFWNIGGEWDPAKGLGGLRGDGQVTQAQIDDFFREAV